MPKPTREEVESALQKIPPEQHAAFLAEVERRLSSDTIGSTPWYDKPAWSLSTPLSVGQEGPTALGAVDALPAVVGMVGGMLGGAGAGIPTGGWAAPLGAIKGAALGGAAGEAARQMGRRVIGAPAPGTSLDAALGIGREAVSQGAQEALGQGIGAAVKGALIPGRGSIDPVVTAARDRLARSFGRDVELPASAIAMSRPVSYAEATAAEGFGGGGALARMRNAALHLTAIADQTVTRASNLTDDVTRGEAISKGLDAYKQAWITAKQGLYAQVDRDMPGLTMEAPKTVALLNSVNAEKAGAQKILQEGPVSDAKFYQGLLNGLTTEGPDGASIPKTVGVKDLRAAIREIDQKVAASYSDPFAAANKGLLQKLSATLDDDLSGALRRQAPQVAANLEAANAHYAEGISKINSTFGSAIHKFAQEGKYDLIAKAVANARMSVADVPRIMEVAGPEGTDALRASVLAQIVSKAKGTEKVSGEYALTPRGIEREIKRFGRDRLEAILTPEQFSNLNDLATTSGALERAQKIIYGSPTAGKGRWLAYGSAVTGAVTGHPAALAYLLGDVAFNKFISTQAGQRWLTTGFPRAAEVAGGLARQIPRAVAASKLFGTVQPGEESTANLATLMQGEK